MAKERTDDPLKSVISHPEYSKVATPSSIELDETERRLINLGVGIDVGAEQQAHLKVFQEQDNQLRVEDLDRVPIQCFNCGGQGEYVIAVTQVPKFGKAEISSFSCDDCGYTGKRARRICYFRYNFKYMWLNSAIHEAGKVCAR